MKWLAGLAVVCLIGAGVWWWNVSSTLNDAIDRSDLPPSPAHPPEPDYVAELKLIDDKLRAVWEKVLLYRKVHDGKPVVSAKSFDDLKLPGTQDLFSEQRKPWSLDAEVLAHSANRGRRAADGVMTPSILLPFLRGPSSPEPDMDWIRRQGEQLPIAFISEGALGIPVEPIGKQRYRLIRLDGSISWHTADPKVPESQLFPNDPASDSKDKTGPPTGPRRLGRR